MEPDVNAAVESSTPATNFEPETYTAEEHDTWQATGKLPDLVPSKDAASTPAKETAGAVQTDKPATESAPVPQQQEQGKARGAEARKAELAAEIQELLKQRAALKAKPDVPVADPSPAPKAVAKPVKPVFGEIDGETWEQFETRSEDYSDRKIAFALAEDRKAREAERAEAAAKAAADEIQETWKSRVEAVKSKHADWEQVALSKDVPISDVMDGFLIDSDVGPEILYYFGGHVDEAKAIAAMPPYKAARALVAIEKSLAGGEAAQPAKTPVVIPPTKAARPATDLRSTNAAPLDEMRAAVEADDFTRFSEVQNAKSIARRKQG